MAEVCRSALLIRLTLAFCLVTTLAVARAQDVEPIPASTGASDRASAALSRNRSQQLQGTGDAVAPRHSVSRWERLRHSIWPFRSKADAESSSGQKKRRSLLGEKVKYAPGEGPEFPDFSPMKADSSVSRTKHEVAQEPPPPAAPSLPSNAAGAPGLPGPAGSGNSLGHARAPSRSAADAHDRATRNVRRRCEAEAEAALARLPLPARASESLTAWASGSSADIQRWCSGSRGFSGRRGSQISNAREAGIPRG